MQRVDHPLLSPSLGSHKTLSSFHYGTPGARPKVYVQASLHAEELPGMLVAHHLRQALQALEDAGRITGEIIVVPVANPIGLAQRLDHKPMGRFELDTSENFNRHYPDLAQHVWPQVQNHLGADAQTNVALVRQAMRDWLQQQTATTELQSMRLTLVQLACDADHVLDLHCDCEAVMHLYTEDTCWPQLAPLAQCLGARVVLLARNSGSQPFDECLSGVWWRLAERMQAARMDAPLPQACLATTIELRGETDVAHAHARHDAQALLNFMQHAGVLNTGTTADLPAALCEATPLAGSETLNAAVPGVVAFALEPGQRVQAGDLVAEVIDPVQGTVHAVRAGVSGLLYARVRDRYVTSGGELGKIAGSVAFRTGELLGD